MIIDISDMPLEDQKKKLQGVMADWKGDSFQIDDILVFGIQFI